MFWKLNKRKIRGVDALFNGHFVEVKALYALEFDAISCVTFIGELDISAAFAFISENFEAEIACTWQHSYYEHNNKRMFFNNTIFVLSNKRIIELAGNYCQVLHTPKQYSWASDLVIKLSRYKIVNNGASIGFMRQSAVN